MMISRVSKCNKRSWVNVAAITVQTINDYLINEWGNLKGAAKSGQEGVDSIIPASEIGILPAVSLCGKA